MPKGFIYVVTTAKYKYQQKTFRNVPTEWQKRLYFGPCKRNMRPGMNPGDHIFGISPSSPKPRRILFASIIEERISFQEAYERFPDLRGPDGPIHVRPVSRPSLPFPMSKYEHIPGAMHEDNWKKDLAVPALDAFFVIRSANDWHGRWLGAAGPVIEDTFMDFLQSCSVHNRTGVLSERNPDGTVERPIAYGGLFTGLHLETDNPERLLEICEERLSPCPGLPGRSHR